MTGRYCEQEVNICVTDNPCENSAPCEMVEDSYRCMCPIGYTGRTCAIGKPTLIGKYHAVGDTWWQPLLSYDNYITDLN